MRHLPRCGLDRCGLSSRWSDQSAFAIASAAAHIRSEVILSCSGAASKAPVGPAEGSSHADVSSVLPRTQILFMPGRLESTELSEGWASDHVVAGRCEGSRGVTPRTEIVAAEPLQRRWRHRGASAISPA